MAQQTPKSTNTPLEASKESRKTRETKTTAASASSEGGTGGTGNTKALEAMINANLAMLKGMAEMQREIMEFSNTRLRLDVETQEALAHCSDLREAFQVQSDFTQKAMRGYAEEAAKLMSLSAKVSNECRDPLEHATRIALETLTPH